MLLPRPPPTTALNPPPPPRLRAGWDPRGRGLPQRPDALPALPSAPHSLLQRLPSPEAGMGSSPLPYTGSRAENLWLWMGSWVPSTGGEQSHYRACSLPPSHPVPGKEQSPEMLPPPRWRLSPHNVPRREGSERSLGCQKAALASKKMM